MKVVKRVQKFLKVQKRCSLAEENGRVELRSAYVRIYHLRIRIFGILLRNLSHEVVEKVLKAHLKARIR